MRIISDTFRLCKSETACIFEVGAGAGEGEMAYVQMKKVLLEISQAMLAGEHEFRLIDWNRKFQP